MTYSDLEKTPDEEMECEQKLHATEKKTTPKPMRLDIILIIRMK